MGVQTMSFVKFENVYKRYKMGEITINAADGVSFEIEKGEFAVIVGASGAGKTTILNMLGGMDTCDEGKILVDGKDIATFNKKQLTTYRRYDIGFVFQFYNLVNNLTAKENVELATQIFYTPFSIITPSQCRTECKCCQSDGQYRSSDIWNLTEGSLGECCSVMIVNVWVCYDT
jgi:ABC-type lipoprotein export system ATPase subunit